MLAPPDELPALFPPDVPKETSERTGRGCSSGCAIAGTGVGPTTMIGTFAALMGPLKPPA